MATLNPDLNHRNILITPLAIRKEIVERLHLLSGQDHKTVDQQLGELSLQQFPHTREFGAHICGISKKFPVEDMDLSFQDFSAKNIDPMVQLLHQKFQQPGIHQQRPFEKEL